MEFRRREFWVADRTEEVSFPTQVFGWGESEGGGWVWWG